MTTEPGQVISTAQAIRDALAEAGRADPSVMLFAEGVRDPNGFWGTLANLEQVYGRDRMIEMPVAENGLVGIAIGAAMAGKRPVISLQRVEFALLALEQLANNAAKGHYASNGLHKVPLVVRLVVGRGWGQGPAHSQSLETMFAMFPGFKVIMPTHPADAKGMLAAAVRDDNPVIVIEHRWCHYVEGQVPDGDYVAPIDGPKVVQPGSDVTVVGSSYMTLEAERAAKVLGDQGVSAEVLDLRVIRPLNMELIRQSVAKTGRLVVVDTGFKMLGIGAEIVSQLVESGVEFAAPPVRLGLPDHPTPSSRGLIGDYYPDAQRIVDAIGGVLDLDTDKVAAAKTAIEVARGDLPVDVPDQYFKGPF